MPEKPGPRYFWMRLALILGMGLGLLLLIQSVVTYRYVSRRMVLEQLERESARQVAFLERHARQMGVRDVGQLADVLEDIRTEGARRIAWIRILDGRGQVLVESGRPVGAPFRPEAMRALFEERREVTELRSTPAGEVCVTLHALRLPLRPPQGPPPAPRPPDRAAPGARPGLRFAEIALFVEGANTAFWPLRRHLMVNFSAAVALVASTIFIWLRFGSYVRARQLEQQLELARQVQRDLLPSSGLDSREFDVAGACFPALEVGGDFYDVFAAGPGRTALVLGDVSGKGLPAALLMALIHGAVRASNWTAGTEQHEASTRRLNELLCSGTSPDRFASLFWCYYDAAEGVLRYINAGHLPPLVFRRDAAAPLKLDEGGPVLGVVPDAEYRQSSVRLAPGDLVVMYSDGIVEAENPRGDQFGEERLLEILQENHKKSSEEIRNEVLTRVRVFLGGAHPPDDLTLLVARVQAAGAQALAA
ncbi:MAG: PP2C family protein-serine/threonine phosphatase [Bryobacterales bacterium]|nr:PP2C family protein-serine/threonine phosphatase [Bryobacteraceae bacterium]MDW8356179.1 PP2C family protein-serine/threonine phosphatase [Bryobacterales bacterium]